MPRVELSHGEWADMRDIDDLRRADIRAVFKAADDAGISMTGDGTTMLGLATIQDVLVVRFVTAWSFTNGDGPLPITVECLDELRQADVQKLGDYVNPALVEALRMEEPDPTSAAPSSPSASSG